MSAAATQSSGSATEPRRRPRALLSLATMAVCVLAGWMLVSSAVNARGQDLRPTRNDDLAGLVADQAGRNDQLSREVAAARKEVDLLTAQQGEGAGLAQPIADRAAQAGLTAVKGPAVRVSLSDAPLSVRPAGVAEDLLVVHQQDIQQVVNAMWFGGAEAMTIQGQRVVSTTAVKCVGNTVVLHGVPYAPPYVIVAIGDHDRLEQALASSPGVRTFREYAVAYQLGYSQSRLLEVTLPGYQGSVDTRSARIP